MSSSGLFRHLSSPNSSGFLLSLFPSLLFSHVSPLRRLRGTSSTFLSYVPANVGSAALTSKVLRVLRSHDRSCFLAFERDGNVWCVLCFTRTTAGGTNPLCEVHHWYKHKTLALHKLATSISKTFDIAEVRLLPYSFQEKSITYFAFLCFRTRSFRLRHYRTHRRAGT